MWQKSGKLVCFRGKLAGNWWLSGQNWELSGENRELSVENRELFVENWGLFGGFLAETVVRVKGDKRRDGSPQRHRDTEERIFDSGKA
jgi:hypothetical protein